MSSSSQRRVILTTHELEIDVLDILDRAFVTKDFASTSELTPGRAFFCDQRIDHTGALVGLSRPLAGCQQCTASAREKEALYQEFRHSTRLPAIDYYSGGGGGIQGGADCFDHRYAVEKDVNCCHTLRQNFPNMTVICQSVGAASQHAHLARGRRIRYPGQLGAEPSLPKTGSMSLALAGPPCQGHTGANHQNKLLDPRNDEVFTAIDEIERLRPDIFILENVPGMKMEKDEINVEDTRNYTLAAVRRLRRIGYQCRVTVLDARSFGSPQNRKRLFIVCARQGVPLPTNPEPTHANPELTVNSFAIDGSARLFYVGPKGTQGSAPYPAVTVRDALSDMPAFDYELGQMGLGMRFAADGQSGDRVGFRQLVAYARPAANDYQHRLRGGNGAVFDHYTPTRSARVLRIIAAASVMVGEKSGTDVQGKDRRINPDRGATTLLTDSGPGGMYTGAIHWDQRRTLTVAERKRLQGVPDSYKLSGSVQEQDRMLGNMINVDMSRALHGHIHREVFFPAWLEMGQPCGDDFFKIWRERYPV